MGHSHFLASRDKVHPGRRRAEPMATLEACRARAILNARRAEFRIDASPWPSRRQPSFSAAGLSRRDVKVGWSSGQPDGENQLDFKWRSVIIKMLRVGFKLF